MRPLPLNPSARIGGGLRPRLSAELKVEVAKFPAAERAHAQEVAEVLEEIMQSASEGRLTLQSRKKGGGPLPMGSANKVMKDKEEFEKQIEEQKRAREEKRKKRDAEIKEFLKKKDEEKKTQGAEAAEVRKREKQKEKDDKRKLEEIR